MLSRQAKEAQKAKLYDNFSRAKAAFLVQCIGLGAEEMTKLRKSLKRSQGDIQVIRNSLSLRAMESLPALKKAFEPQLDGPNAFVMAFEDPAKVAKIIDRLSEENEIFKIKGAVLEGAALSQSEVGLLAKLPSLEALKAQFLGLLSAPLSRFLSTAKEAPQSFARLLSAKKGLS